MFVPDVLKRYAIVARYITAGITGLTVNVAVLFLLSHFFGVWYLFASAIAFVVSLFISFTLQKLWTFKDRGMEIVGRQFLVYLAIALFNLGLNSVLMYFFTSILGIWYVVSQLLTSALVGISSFFLYRAFVFTVVPGAPTHSHL